MADLADQSAEINRSRREDHLAVTGWKSAEAAGRPHTEVFRIVSYLDGRTVPSPLDQALARQQVVALANHTDLIARDGTRFHIADSAAPIRRESGRMIGAILVFRDVSGEYEMRDKLRLSHAQLESSTELTHSAYFQIDLDTGAYTGSKQLTELWPVRDGKLLRAEEWVWPEDLPPLQAVAGTRYEENAPPTQVSFRSDWSGRLCYYRIHTTVMPTPDGRKLLSGSIQDITDITESVNQLKEQRQLWDILIDAIPTLFFVKDMSDCGRYVICNRAFADTLGMSPDEIVGRDDRELYGGEMYAEFRKHDLEAADSEQGGECEDSLTDRTGVVRYYKTSRRPFAVANGHRMLLCAATDVTSLRHLLRCEELCNAVLSQTSVEQDFDRVQDRMAETIMTHLKADRILLNRCENGKLRMYKEWLAPGIASLRPDAEIHEALWNRHLRLACPERAIQISSLAESPYYENLRELADYHTQSLILAPVFVRGELWGALFVDYEKSRHEFSDVDEKMALSMANIIALAVTRCTLAAQVRKSELERGIILNNISIPIWLYDGAGELLRANVEAEKLLSMAPGTVNTANETAFVKAHIPADETPASRLVARTKTSVQREVRIGERIMSIQAEPVFDTMGKLIYVVKSGIDVTALHSWLENQRVVTFCLENFLREEDPARAIDNVLKTVCDYMRADRVFMMRFDEEQCAVYGFQEYFRDGTPPPTEYHGKVFRRDELWFQKFLAHEDVLLPHFDRPEEQQVLGSWTESLVAGGVKSIFCAGSYLDGRICGGFGIVYTSHRHELSKYEKNVIDTIGHMLELLFLRDRARSKLVGTLKSVEKAEKEKSLLLSNEQVLNHGMSAVLRQANPMTAILYVLQLICDNLGASRMYILRHDHQEQQMVPMYEYRRPGTAGETFDFERISFADGSYEQLRKNNLVFIDDVSSRREIARYGLWERQNVRLGIQSLCLATIRINDMLWGNFGITFENGIHHFSAAEKSFISAVSQLIELMIQRTVYQQQILDALEQARSAAKAKSFFLASISHEIRTPLNAVIGFADLLKDPSLDAATRDDYLDSIFYSGNALLQLINDVLDLSSLEAGKMNLVLEPTDFPAMCEENLKMFQFKAEERKISLVGRLGTMPPLLIDKLRVRQILFNLLGNAVKFTSEGSVTLTAEFIPQGTDRGMLTFSVRDTGIGIAPEDQKKLMEPFVQLSRLRGTNSGNNGTGLGLAVSRRLAEKMGGRVALASEPGRGSTFTVEIPAQCSAAAAVTEIAPEVAIPATVPRHRSVLLVDDVQMNLKVLEAVCRKSGFDRVVGTLSGRQALEELEKQSFDLVLTDMWMPEMDGPALAAEIRRDGRWSRLPIFAVTADVEVKENFPLDLFTGVLLKPITLDKLQRLLDALDHDSGGGGGLL